MGLSKGRVIMYDKHIKEETRKAWNLCFSTSQGEILKCCCI